MEAAAGAGYQEAGLEGAELGPECDRVTALKIMCPLLASHVT